MISLTQIIQIMVKRMTMRMTRIVMTFLMMTIMMMMTNLLTRMEVNLLMMMNIANHHITSQSKKLKQLHPIFTKEKEEEMKADIIQVFRVIQITQEDNKNNNNHIHTRVNKYSIINKIGHITTDNK